MPAAEFWIAALLLVTSHSTPAVAGGLMGPRWAWPIDAGVMLRDGRPLFGASKTWRGLALALSASTLATSRLSPRSIRKSGYGSCANVCPTLASTNPGAVYGSSLIAIGPSCGGGNARGSRGRVAPSGKPLG